MKKTEKEEKTNALRILDRAGVPYTVTPYPHDDFVDGITVAALVGKEVHTVFKTLVARGNGGAPLVFIIPVASELDLKKAARAAGVKSVSMLPLSELTGVTGYIRGGCSPVGMKKLFPTYCDQTALSLPEITVSAGRRGLQMTLSPADLFKTVGAKVAELTV